MKKKKLQDRLLNAIPGGAHTYSRGYDQFPYNAPEILQKGKGTYVYDNDNIFPVHVSSDTLRTWKCSPNPPKCLSGKCPFDTLRTW